MMPVKTVEWHTQNAQSKRREFPQRNLNAFLRYRVGKESNNLNWSRQKKSGK
jgi:hypothetical protein